MLLDDRPVSHASVLLASITSVACGSAWFRMFRPEGADAVEGPTVVAALLFGVAQLVIAYVIAGRLRRTNARGLRAGLEVGGVVGIVCACASVSYALMGRATSLTDTLVVAGYALFSAVLMGGLISGVARQRMPATLGTRRAPLLAGSRLGRL